MGFLFVINLNPIDLNWIPGISKTGEVPLGPTWLCGLIGVNITCWKHPKKVA